MRTQDYIRLTTLAAIWGGSFVFMRIVSPVLGPVLTTDLRVLLAGLVLVAWLRATGGSAGWRAQWKHYLVVGVVNSAVPYLLFNIAALHIPAGCSAILNSSSPMFAALCGAIWLGEALTVRKVCGLAIGMAGVAAIAWRGESGQSAMFVPAVIACLVASACYALAGVYLRKFVKGSKPMAIAAGSLLFAGLVLMPPAVATHVPGEFSAGIAGALVGLAVLCTAVGLVFYFRLMADVGPTNTLTVTFLIPVFGILWGFLFLDEAITAAMLGGCALILAGTLLATGFKLPRREAAAASAS